MGEAVIVERLGYRPPLAIAELFGFLGVRAVPGVESWDGHTYRRVLDLPGGPAIVGLSPRDGFVRCELDLDDPRDAETAIGRVRGLLDLDADADVIEKAGRHRPAHAVRRDGQQYAVPGARRDIHRIVANAEARNQFEFSIRRRKGFARNLRRHQAYCVVLGGVIGRDFRYFLGEEFPFDSRILEHLERFFTEYRAIRCNRVAGNTDFEFVGHLRLSIDQWLATLVAERFVTVVNT